MKCCLILKDPIISESCIEVKIELNFYFRTSLWCLKRFLYTFFGINIAASEYHILLHLITSFPESKFASTLFIRIGS